MDTIVIYYNYMKKKNGSYISKIIWKQSDQSKIDQIFTRIIQVYEITITYT